MIGSVVDFLPEASDIITDKRSIKTNVLAEDGQLIVLGGLIEDRIRESDQRVPFLGDLPVLGALFRSKSSDVDKANLMVFIHPTILRDQNTADRYTASKYNFIRAQEAEAANWKDGVFMNPLPPPQLPEMEKLLELPPPFEASPQAAPAAGAVDQDG